MMRHLLFAGLVITASAATAGIANADGGQWREGQPPMATEGLARPGQPVTLPAPPPAIDPERIGIDRFVAAYARAGRPRIAILWNRELTADADTPREEVTTLTVDGHSQADGWQRETARRHGSAIDAGARAEHHGQAEWRTSMRALDPGVRPAPSGENDDFDTERGFADMLAGAGTRLIDRTAIVRTGALGTDTANLQAIETRALLDKADWTLEVVPMAGGRWRIVARDLAGGRVVARAVGTGRSLPRTMAYVAGDRGFTRGVAAVPTPYATGRQLALETMRALTPR